MNYLLIFLSESREGPSAPWLQRTGCYNVALGHRKAAEARGFPARRFPQRAPRRRRQKPKPSPAKKVLRLSLGLAAVVLAVRSGRALPALVGGVSSRLRPRRKQPLPEAAPMS